jgi:HSP20 family protein
MMSQFSRLNRGLLNDFFNEPSSLGYFVRPLHGEGLPDSFKVDIKETESAYVVHAEIPGVKKEDLNVTVDAGKLTIAAEIKQFDQAKEGEKIVRSERYYGSLARSFQLPLEVDQDASTAKYENGILELILTKKMSTGVKKLKVH